MEWPPAPNPEDCCNSGCNPCILDAYEAQLQTHQRSTNLRAQNIPGENVISCICKTQYTIFALVSREPLSPNVDRLKFKFVSKPKNVQSDKSVKTLNYKPGQYFMLNAENCTRSYTPIPHIDGAVAFEHNAEDGDTFAILVKYYERGNLSKYLQRLPINAHTKWRGPYGEDTLSASLTANTYKKCLFVAQGVGIAPNYALINAMLANDGCECFIMLFYCCRRVCDVVLRDELQDFLSYWNFSCVIYLSCDTGECTPRYNETVKSRRINSNDFEEFFRDGVDGVGVLLAGSTDFCNEIKGYVAGSGVQTQNVHLFE